MEATDRHSIFTLLHVFKILIDDTVDEFNFLFLISFLSCVPFLHFSCYLIKCITQVP